MSMETVEKRVQLEEDACKMVIESMNASPIGKIFLELMIAEQINVMRTNLKSMVCW